MLEKIECVHCGAKLDIDMSQQVVTCEYCGGKLVNKEFKKEVPLAESQEVVEKNIVTMGERPKMNGCLLAFLLVLCWPAGVGYLIYKLVKKSEWDNQNKG